MSEKIHNTKDMPMMRVVGFDDCVLGIASRCGGHDLLAYSTEKICQKLHDRDGMSLEAALEFFEYNIAGAYMGELSPVFVAPAYDLD